MDKPSKEEESQAERQRLVALAVPQPNREPPALPISSSHDRLSIATPFRIFFGMFGASLTGLFLGLSHGSKLAGMRFRAENAHRFPTTQKGWYLYHKSKNYHAMLGGIKDGVKMAGRLPVWVGAFFATEAVIDSARGGNKDFASTTIAGMGVGAGFGAWERLPVRTLMRTVRMGLYGGLVFGLAQDVVMFAKGGRLRYVDLVLGRNGEVESSQD